MSDVTEKKRPGAQEMYSGGGLRKEAYIQQEADAIFESLESERDTLKARVEALTGEKFSDRNHAALKSRAEQTESDLAREKERIARLRELVSDLSDYAPSAENGGDGRYLWVRIREALEAR